MKAYLYLANAVAGFFLMVLVIIVMIVLITMCAPMFLVGILCIRALEWIAETATQSLDEYRRRTNVG